MVLGAALLSGYRNFRRGVGIVRHHHEWWNGGGYPNALADNQIPLSGRIVGILTDQNGGLVPGASVLVKNEKTGEERTIVSTSDGTFMVSALRPSNSATCMRWRT